jgi:hypothetical protein
MLEPDSLYTELQEIKARLHALETAPRMPHVTQKGGSYILKNDSGEVLFTFGAYVGPAGDTEFGVNMLDNKADAVLAITDGVDGMLYPTNWGQWYDPTPATVTSGSFVSLREARVFYPNHDGLHFTAPLQVPAGTTAEVQVYSLSSAGVISNVLSVAGAFNGTVSCWWRHPFTVGWGDNRPGRSGDVLIAYQVRRSAGAGNVTAYPPRSLDWTSTRFLPSAPWSDTTPLTAV